jgi:multisubunit Na+/H+ antiporter MnhB subunit
MPDDIIPSHRPRYEPRPATEAGLEFIMERIADLPTRRELIRFRIWVALGLCVAALIGLLMWERVIAACGGE